MSNRIRKGDRIRLKVRTAFGWIGFGVAIEDQPEGDNPVIAFHAEGCNSAWPCLALRSEVVRCRQEEAP